MEEREGAERKELRRKMNAGRTHEANRLVADLRNLHKGDTAAFGPPQAEAFQLIVLYARQTLGMTEERFAELEAKARTGHLAPNADLRRPLSFSDNGRPQQRAKGLEPSTTSLEGWYSSH